MAVWLERSGLGAAGGGGDARAAKLAAVDGRGFSGRGAAGGAAAPGLFAWEGMLATMLQRAEGGHYEPALGPAMTKLIDEQVAATIKAAPDASKEAANRQWGRLMLGYVARRLREGVREPARQEASLRGLDLLRECERAILSNVRLGDVDGEPRGAVGAARRIRGGGSLMWVVRAIRPGS